MSHTTGPKLAISVNICQADFEKSSLEMFFILGGGFEPPPTDLGLKSSQFWQVDSVGWHAGQQLLNLDGFFSLEKNKNAMERRPVF